jgi:hypothetical protein
MTWFSPVISNSPQDLAAAVAQAGRRAAPPAQLGADFGETLQTIFFGATGLSGQLRHRSGEVRGSARFERAPRGLEAEHFVDQPGSARAQPVGDRSRPPIDTAGPLDPKQAGKPVREAIFRRISVVGSSAIVASVHLA